MTDYGLRLHPEHAAMLAASGIDPDRALARGYVTVDTKTRLEQLGITKAGRHVPGLLVPSLRADGSTWGYQYRPDEPRLRDGKPVKYETPVGQRNGIDVPPGVGPQLADPRIPLWVTEGVKKADAAAAQGLACIALPGVWSWRGSNDKGGKTAVPDWHDVALNDRRVILAFDSDVVRKPAVRNALTELAGYLATKGAAVEYLHLPDDVDKTGLDDFLVDHAVEQAWQLVRPEPPPVDSGAGSAGSATSAGSIPRGTAPMDVRKDEVRRYPPGVLSRTVDDVRDWLGRFICTMHDADLDLLALWAAHTHLVVETYTTPRLILDSPVPGSGKTTVLEHYERLCFHPVQMASLSSPALLTRMLDAGLRTILIDEADRSLNPDKDGVAELLAVLNSGYKRGGTRPVLVPSKDNSWQAREMPTFAPVAMAGNNPNLPEDTRSRSIRVLLMPDVDGSIEDSDWEFIEDEALELGSRLAAWADTVRADVRARRPDLPAGIRGRAKERWAPLARVAAALGGRWPAVVEQLAVDEMRRLEIEREDGIVQQKPAVVLLHHLHEVWPDDAPFVPTDVLIDRLVDHAPDTWGPMSTFGKRLTAQRLGRMLVTGYNIHSARPDSSGPRGYLYAALLPALRRFNLTPAIKPAEPAEPAEPARRRLGLAGPDRCPDCEFHVPTQSHRADCPRREAS